MFVIAIFIMVANSGVKDSNNNVAPNQDWMDGWPAMETDAGRAVMKTPATKAKDLFKVVLPTPVATTLSISRAVDNHLATKYSK